MRLLFTIVISALSLNAIAQTNPNYNPDFDANGVIGVDDLLGFLESFGETWDSGDVIVGCTYPAAVEYNPSANVDDGSCTFLPDCAGVINGTSVLDDCGTCDNDSTNDCLQDCNGDWGGTAELDECGVCGGDGIAEGACDCDGNVLDECGVCGGDGSSCSGAECGDDISHEGYDYSTVLIGEQCWFAENCRYLPEVSPNSVGSETDPYYYVYDYEGTDVASAQATSNYDTYGVLYNWPAVMTEGVCPSGWHIPTDGEWQTMEISLGMSEAEAVQTGWRGSPVGDYMKSTSGWNDGGNGSNSSGFTGLPGGYRYSGGFYDDGNYGGWWSASESGYNSWLRELYNDDDYVYRGNYVRYYGFSARCVRDYTDECGVLNGDNSTCADDCGVPNGDNSSCAGCDGVANSGLVIDECGVCGGDNSTCLDECGVLNGDNSSCADCAGIPYGTSVVDECGVCGGSGIPEGECDCDGNVLDECGVCGGDNSTCLDECGVLNGDNSSCADCAGIPYGTSVVDECGVCGGSGIPEGECDCDGNVLDECGVCGGDNSTCSDECGVPNGDNSTCTDCLGVVNGDGLVSHEGYDYSTVLIGEQCWFSENCRYLPQVSPSSEGSYIDSYYYVYGYEGTDVAAATSTSNYATYGVLYNWPAVMTEGICPSGWHIPTDGEFTQLTDFLGGEGVAGGKMKEAGYDHWVSPNLGATNSSGWTGLPGGFRSSGGFYNYGTNGGWWSASESGSDSWRRTLYNYNVNVHRYGLNRDFGFSARCVRD